MKSKYVEVNFYIFLTILISYDLYNAEPGRGLFSISLLYLMYLLIERKKESSYRNIASYLFVFFAVIGTIFDFYYGQTGRAIGGLLIACFIYKFSRHQNGKDQYIHKL